MKLFALGIPDMFRGELVERDNSNVESCVDQALTDSGIDIDRDSVSYQRLCRQMKINLIRFAEIEQKRQKADYPDFQ